MTTPPQTRRDPLAEQVEEIIASYEAEPSTRHIGAARLASRDGIIQAVKLLRELLFPGYFGNQDLAPQALRYHVGRLLLEISARLRDEIHSALLHAADPRGQGEEARPDGARVPGADPRVAADRIVAEFIQTIPRLRSTLASDVRAAFEGDPAATGADEIIFSYPGFFAITVYRIAHELYVHGVPLVPRVMSEYAHSVTGIDINAGATIADSFFIDHGTGVVIGETTHIGRRVKIYQGVTLGALSTRGGQKLRGSKRHPTLEDDVTVYSGASILGGETVIGRGAVIASNVFVTRSVPPYTRVTVPSPELQYRDQKPQAFKQDLPEDWVI